jgi:hypothetical protein
MVCSHQVRDPAVAASRSESIIELSVRMELLRTVPQAVDGDMPVSTYREVFAASGVRAIKAALFTRRCTTPSEVIDMTARIHRRKIVTGLISEYRRAA